MLQPRPPREQRIVLLKVIYTLESNTAHTLVARLPQPVTVTVLPAPKARGARARREAQAAAFSNLSSVEATAGRFASVPLKSCLGAICMASPDLIMDQSKDYILYAVDAVENHKNSLSATLIRSASYAAAPSTSAISSSPASSSKPNSPHKRSVLAGKGYFSRALEEPGDGQSIVNGRIVGGSTYDVLFPSGEDDDDDEEDEETLEIVLRLKEVERASRDQYYSLLGGLQQQQQQQPRPSSSLLALSNPPTAGPSSLSQISISRTVSDPNLMTASTHSLPLPSLDMGPPSFPASPLSWQIQDPSPIAHHSSISAGNTPAQDVSTPNQGMGMSSTEAQRQAPTPGTQAQLLSLLHMLQQRQPSTMTANETTGAMQNSSLVGLTTQSTSNELAPPDPLPPPPLPPPSAASSSADSAGATLQQQQQLADVLGGLAGMMGISLPLGLLAETSQVHGGNAMMASSETVGSNAPTPQSVSNASVAVVGAALENGPPEIGTEQQAQGSTTHTPATHNSPLPPLFAAAVEEPCSLLRALQQATPTNTSSSASFSAHPQSGLGVPSSVAHFGSAPSSSAKRGSLDAIAEQRSRKIRRKVGAGGGGSSSIHGGESPAAASASGSGSTSTSAPAPAAVGLGASLSAVSGLVTSVGIPSSSRAGSVDGGRATSVASEARSSSAAGNHKKERKYNRRAARERAAATAAANLAGRERSAAALVGGGAARSTRSSGAGVGQHPASEAGLLGVGGKKAGKVGSRKRADVRAGAAALAAQPAPTTATTAATTRASSASSQQQQQQNGEPSSHARTSGLLGASSRSIAHITFAQSSPIRYSSSGASSNTTKVDSISSFGTLGTPLGLGNSGGNNLVARYSFPKHLLQSSPGTAFDTLLSEGDLDFDGFAIPHGLFGSPSRIHDALGGGGGGGGGSRHSRTGTGDGSGSGDRCPSTPLRRSPRKNPPGTHASMNPYATSTAGGGGGGGGGGNNNNKGGNAGAEHDLFGSDGESPLFGFVNMSPASGRSGRIGAGAGAGAGVGGSASRKALSSANDGDGDGEGEGEGNDDPFASPSARRAQRRLPSHQGGNKGTPVLGSGIGSAGTGTGAGAGPTTMSLSALMVSPNLNEVDFAALLRTNLGGGGGGPVGHDLGSLLTGSPVRLCSRAL
ncbi:hypothetical protein A4X03_0g4845 [Tilletia caries]|uniref:Uncharacterized protein n=1 Tax=Tilletia caries TaxID=13290 RepID=A0A177ULS8_9BASI|nr:hypothetical protein A4X03_0g4845 [Tilletia caries]